MPTARTELEIMLDNNRGHLTLHIEAEGDTYNSDYGVCGSPTLTELGDSNWSITEATWWNNGDEFPCKITKDGCQVFAAFMDLPLLTPANQYYIAETMDEMLLDMEG